MKKRLLIATYHRLDENTGGSNGSKGFIHCFANLFDDCSIVCQTFDNVAQFIPSTYKIYPYHEHRDKIQLAIDIYRGVIFGLYYAIKEHLKTHLYDVIVIDHSITGAAIIKDIKTTGAKIITIHHNVERDYLFANARQHSLTYRLPYLYYAKKAERDCLRMSDVNLTVTEHDAQVFRSWYPNIHVYNWGNFEYRPIPDKVFTQSSKKKIFVITGSLDFQQSLLPIMDFIHRYWPVLRHECPQAQLLIAGRQPAEELQAACAKAEGITIVPNPGNMAAIVAKANYYLCPIFTGSGRKLRILDGLKQGLPVLCHEVAAAGYERFCDCGYMFSYNDEQSFTTSLQQMLSARILPQQVYEAFRDAFSIRNGTERLRHILEQENIIRT